MSYEIPDFIHEYKHTYFIKENLFLVWKNGKIIVGEKFYSRTLDLTDTPLDPDTGLAYCRIREINGMTNDPSPVVCLGKACLSRIHPHLLNSSLVFYEFSSTLRFALIRNSGALLIPC